MRSLFSFCLLWISEGKRTPRKLRRRILWRQSILRLTMDGLVTVQMWLWRRETQGPSTGAKIQQLLSFNPTRIPN